MGVQDFTIYDLIQTNAGSFGNKPAWYEVADGRSLTFKEIKEQVGRVAAGLHKFGITRGDRIAVLGKNSLEYFLLYGAASALGAMVLALNWRLSPEELTYNAQDAKPMFVFTDEEFQPTTREVLGQLAFVEKTFNLMGDRGSFEPFSSLLENDGVFPTNPVRSKDGLVIIHTAAVTGKPKGVVLTHENLLATNISLFSLFQLTPQDIHLSLLPFFHVGGLTATWGAFHGGCLNINVSKFEAGLSLQLIQEKKVTFFLEFPPILASILDQQEKTGADISSLRIVTGVENPETIERLQRLVAGVDFWPVYGQTETTSEAVMGPYMERPGSIGKPVPMSIIKLVDHNDREVPAGTTGEMIIKGPMVFKEYWKLPEDTAYTFRGGWHHTGDLARYDADGFLFYAGRKAEKELIKPGGENVYPQEVEKVILEHPAVEKTVVFGVPDPEWGEAVKAVCQLKTGQKLETRELIDFVSQRIARYKKPKHVVFVDQLPAQEDGFPDRVKVKELYK